MMYDFDEVRDRSRVGKWENATKLGAIGMGVADMDFKLAPEIIEAVKDCAEAGEFGYVGMKERDYEAVLGWIKYRTGETIPREWLLATSGVLYTTRTAMYELTREGEKVILQPPLHTPSIASASMLGRIPLKNKMIYRDGRYTMDMDHLEKCFREGGRVLMMCAPNNPTGRVWTREELEDVATLVNRYDAYVVSDEIHRDIVWEGHRHVSPVDIPSLRDRTIVALSTSKTFNMGGFHIGSAIVPNAELKERLRKRFYNYGHACGRPSTLCVAAQTAAYTKGHAWFESMMRYVGKNMEIAADAISDLPIHAVKPEGTFLLWIDVSEMNMDTMELQRVMEEEWRVLCDRGIIYDTAAYADKNPKEHHLRMNMATTHANVEEAFSRIRAYFKS